MDINARINWKPGMEITAQTFISLDEHLDFRQQLALRAALGNQRMGLLPGATFSCNGMFVKNKFEIDRLSCLAVLPSGRLIHPDDQVELPIPMLYGTEYYLTVGIGEGTIEFEHEDIGYRRPQYVYALHTLEEVAQADVFPVVRFRVDNGMFSIDPDFIPPCLLLSANDRFKQYLEKYTELTQTLSTHPNLEEGEGRRLLQRYLFLLKGYHLQNSVYGFVQLQEEMAQAIDYYIMMPHAGESRVEVPVPNQCDIQKWLQWFENYLQAAITVLDGVVLENKEIDYEALLAQAKKELYEQLNPELYTKLLSQIKEELHQELEQRLTQSLTAYFNDVLKPELNQVLRDELREDLYEKLYFELFEQLFNALYVPEPEEKAFIPQI